MDFITLTGTQFSAADGPLYLTDINVDWMIRSTPFSTGVLLGCFHAIGLISTFFYEIFGR